MYFLQLQTLVLSDIRAQYVPCLKSTHKHYLADQLFTYCVVEGPTQYDYSCRICFCLVTKASKANSCTKCPNDKYIVNKVSNYTTAIVARVQTFDKKYILTVLVQNT